MKGLIFVEFIELMDEKFGPEFTEEVISGVNLPSKAQYTNVGTYDDGEMSMLLEKVSEKTKIHIPKLLIEFGHHLFNSFKKKHPQLIGGMNDSFELLKKIDDYIHVEVRKIYDHAQLPTFDHEEVSASELNLVYRSERKLPWLALGLIEATMVHFNEVYRIDEEVKQPDFSHVLFRISRYDKVTD